MAKPQYYAFFVSERQDLSEIFDLGFQVSQHLTKTSSNWRQFAKDHIWPQRNGWIRVDHELPSKQLGQSFGNEYTPDIIPTVYLEDGEWPCEIIAYDQYVELLGGGSGFLADDLKGVLGL